MFALSSLFARFAATSAGLALLVIAGLLPGPAPAYAAEALPRVMLGTEPLHSGPVVGYHYTARSDTSTGSWPSGSTLHYQWFQGDKDATPASFIAIRGATAPRYTMSAADHWHRIKVRVQATRAGAVVGEKFSSASNFILFQMQTPRIVGRPLVGQVLTATLSPGAPDWTSDWNVAPAWRRGGVGTPEMKDIPGATGLTYRARPADVGKLISMLTMATHQFPQPNPTLAIDRRWGALPLVAGSIPPIRWATWTRLRGVTSPAKGRLRFTAIVHATSSVYKADQTKLSGRVAVYDGARLIGRYSVKRGHRLITLAGLRHGSHSIRAVFLQNNTYAGSRVSGTASVR